MVKVVTIIYTVDQYKPDKYLKLNCFVGACLHVQCLLPLSLLEALYVLPLGTTHTHTHTHMHTYTHIHTYNHSSYMTSIGVYEMHGRVHLN